MTESVVVTGVAGGVGSATAAAFRAEGWRVIGIDRREPADETKIDEFHQIDVADLDSFLAALTVLERGGPVQALVNNAAVAMDKPFSSLTLGDWQTTMDVNVRSAFLLSQRLLPRLESARGAIVNVSSVHAVATSSGVTAYATSKGALVALTRALAVELGASGVRVNAILPGAVDTMMLRAGLFRQSDAPDVEAALAVLASRTPLKVIGRPADIAAGIVFLADNRQSGFMTGQVLVVDGGATARLSTE